jgi:hypothetical protein
MLKTPFNRKAFFRFILAGLLAVVTGCCSFLNPIDPPPEVAVEFGKELPKYCRDHVYVFFLNGFDPINYGNLSGMREYVDALGFHKTYLGQVYHVGYFADEMKKIHKHEPDAHFVLVGFGCGARKIRSLADRVNSEGISVDLMVYLDGKLPDNLGLENDPVIGTIHDGGLTSSGSNPNLWLFGSPTNPKTVQSFGQQLMHLALTIPAPETMGPEQLPPPMNEPTPRPVKRQVPSQNGEWDFLKPASNRVHLQNEDQRAAGGFSG